VFNDNVEFDGWNHYIIVMEEENNMTRVATYRRVSTEKQNADNQSESLNKQIEIFGWNKVMDYSETISGTKDTRPELQRLLSDARLGKFDYVMVYELSRLGRSTIQVINTIHELEQSGVHCFIIKNAINTKTPQGRMFSQMISIFSQLEIDLNKSRQQNAIKRLREKGAKWGTGNLLTEETRQKILSLRTNGLSYRKIANSVGCSLGSVQNTLKSVGV